MRRPKIKRRRNHFLVYREKNKAFICMTENSAALCYNVLLIEYNKQKTARAARAV